MRKIRLNTRQKQTGILQDRFSGKARKGPLILGAKGNNGVQATEKGSDINA